MREVVDRELRFVPVERGAIRDRHDPSIIDQNLKESIERGE